MLWYPHIVSFHHGSVGSLVQIDENINQKMYKNILEYHILPFARSNMPRGWMYQQSKSVKQWFQSKKVKLLEWPNQSPDLTPIENLWDDIRQKVGQQRHSPKAELLQDLKFHWSKISKSTLEALIESMPRRCAALIKSKDYVNKY